MFGFLAPYRLYAYLALAVALVGGYFYWKHHVFQDGYSKGAESIQVKFDVYRGDVAREAEQRRVENAIKDAKTDARNEAVENGYKQALAAIATDRDSLARWLREYQARASSLAMSCNQGISPAIDASEKPPSEAEFDRLYDEYDQACRQDAAQLNALIEELKGQM